MKAISMGKKLVAVAVLAQVESQSRTGISYEIRLGHDNVVYCTCPAWRFSRAGDCKHLRAFHAEMASVAATKARKGRKAVA